MSFKPAGGRERINERISAKGGTTKPPFVFSLLFHREGNRLLVMSLSLGLFRMSYVHSPAKGDWYPNEHAEIASTPSEHTEIAETLLEAVGASDECDCGPGSTCQIGDESCKICHKKCSAPTSEVTAEHSQ